ncbi:MAG: DUF1810 domain-containing protein [Clostridia bacterium]|nr:DUF1810 domain-containing protein [Clostridia bacterium]
MDLSRFKKAHEGCYKRALAEIRTGCKESHWMWFIFPQFKGLGRSFKARYYAIKSIEEARAFLGDSYLGGNLREISRALLVCETNNAEEVFGYIDAMKLKSSMTLFDYVADELEENKVFRQVLDKFFDGVLDTVTLEIIK